ncbi:MAG: FG-GAP repeat protein [Nannocystaceae bacterium]|nr:FG-GAP repeat protein [Nannocystaceae bacterium]
MRSEYRAFTEDLSGQPLRIRARSPRTEPRSIWHSWAQEAYVKASNTNVGDEFGASVALSDTLAVDEGSSAVGVDGDQADNTAGSATGAGRRGFWPTLDEKPAPSDEHWVQPASARTAGSSTWACTSRTCHRR